MIESQPIADPAWLVALIEDVVHPAVGSADFMGPLGYRYWSPPDADGEWRIAVYPTPLQLNDNCLCVMGFSLDVWAIQGEIADIEECVWVSPTRHNSDLDGPEVSIRGRFLGHRIWLRFFHIPPPDEAPSYAVDPRTRATTPLP
jgi:hypothetical protein